MRKWRGWLYNKLEKKLEENRKKNAALEKINTARRTLKENLVKIKFGDIFSGVPYKFVIDDFPHEKFGKSAPITFTDSEGKSFGYQFDEEEILDVLIRNDNDVKKAIEFLIKNTEKRRKEYQIEKEMEKIKMRKERRLAREQAEKRVFGKPQTKRTSLTENEKESIFDKFNNQCAVCNAKEGLHIHHKDNNPENNKTDNLVVLCGVCHKKVHIKVR